MTRIKIIIGNDSIMSAIETLYLQGIITSDQYHECLRRYKQSPPENEEDIIIVDRELEGEED